MLNNGDSHASIFLFAVIFVIVNSKNNLNNIISTKKGGEDEDIAEDKTDHFRNVPG